jgi:anthranilate/para-aminobenzoate synthase component I
MVSDVIRNLSGVCLQNSIEVSQVAHIETDSRAHHLVSEVSGTKAPLVTPLDCLLAVLPAVSDSQVSDIVASLEKGPRSVYTGTIGFISFNGTAEFNSAFRTMIFKDTIGYLHSGVEVSKTTDAEEAFVSTQKSAEHIFNLIG